MFQHTAARRRLADSACRFLAAACFNTQPPEGGWVGRADGVEVAGACFNTQPPEGGWGETLFQNKAERVVSTHSRPKAAGMRVMRGRSACWSFNTQPPEGGWARPCTAGRSGKRFQHTAARRRLGGITQTPYIKQAGFNTQPPEGGWSPSQKPCSVRFRSPDFAKLLRKARTRV